MRTPAKTLTLVHPLSVRESGVTPWLTWAKKGGWAVLDQGLFAGANFLINVVLARWLSPADYGAFAIAFSLFLLLATFHTALLVEPMLVFAAKKYAEQFQAYLAILIAGHMGLTAGVSLLLGLLAYGFQEFGFFPLAQAFFGLALAAPAILLLWLFRRVFYVRMQPQWSAIGGFLYLVFTLLGMYGLYSIHGISSSSALLVMGSVSVLVSLWFAVLLHPIWPSARERLAPATVFCDHWAYGKWATAATVLQWLPSNLYYAALPLWGGLEGSAILRAVMNVLMPILHTQTAISMLFLPTFVHTFKTAGDAGLRRSVQRALVLFVGGAVVYWGVLALFHSSLLLWLYGPHYQTYGILLVLAGMLPLWTGIDAVLSTAVRATERPAQVFWAQAVSSVVAVTLGLWLVARADTFGAIVGLCASTSATVLVLTYWYTHQVRKSTESIQ